MRTKIRATTLALATIALTACSQAGALGDILGSVLGGGASLVSGAIRGVDSRNQQISLQQSNGETVALAYDNQTKVVYQNQLYSVTSLDAGDQVNARVQQLQNGGYYTDSVTVVQPASGTGTSTGSTGGTVQSLSGTVRQIDRNNGLFTVDVGNNSLLTVSLAYNASTNDVNRFNSLRSGDFVRFYGVYLNNTRVELRQFY